MAWKRLTICFTALALLTMNSLAADWPSFRGPGAQSKALQDSVPTSWSVEDGTNVAWTAEVPGRGVSGPIVVDGKVIVTSSSGPKEDRLHVTAFDEATGKQLWHRQFWATGRTHFHPMSANATPTPASDGVRVFAFYSSNDLICLDLDGNVQWMHGLVLDHPKLGNDVGMSSSPAVADGVVVVQCESQGDSFAAGFDTATGEQRWLVDRPKQALWASPIPVDKAANGSSAIALQSMYGISLHDPHTGSELWQRKHSCAAISSCAADDGKLYVPGGSLTAFALDNSGDQEPLWDSAQLKPSSPSPVIIDGNVYVIGSAGILVCGDVESGEVVWRRRLGGQFWATPVVVGNHMVCINAEGTAYVVDLLDKGKIISENKFNEAIPGSPAVADNALFVRGYNKVWKIATRGIAVRSIGEALN